MVNERIYFALSLGCIISIGGIFNLSVLRILGKEKKLRKNVPSYFLINLLLIDLINIFLVMPFSLVSMAKPAWEPPPSLQRLNGFLGTTVELASMLALAIISLDRLVAVMKPLEYKARMTVCKSIQCNSYVWTQAILFSLVPVFCDWFVFNQQYSSCTLLSQSDESGFYVFLGFLISCNFLLSLCIILATYMYIFRVARSHHRRISRAVLPSNIFTLGNTQARHDSFRQREVRTATKILFVIGAFIICHLPYACLRMMELSKNSNLLHVSKTFSIATKWASFSKSSLNPFIYFLQQQRFRKAFARLFKSSKNSSLLGKGNKVIPQRGNHGNSKSEGRINDNETAT